MRPLLAALLLVGCATGPSRWTVVGPHETDAAWRARADEVAACVRQVVRPEEPWGGTVVVHPPGPFVCARWEGDRLLCAGFNPAPRIVEVSYTPAPEAGALAHELAHAALCRPSGDCGEAAANAAATAARLCLTSRSP